MPYVKDHWYFEFRNESLEQLNYREAIEGIVDWHKNIEDYNIVREQLPGLLEDAFRQLGGMQRDGLFYYNFLENAKRGGQAAADQIRPMMSEFGMSSADLPPPDGPPESLVGRWIDYFLRTLADLARRMLRIVVDVVLPGIQKMFTGLQGGLVTIGISAGFPPAIVFDFDPFRIDIKVKDFVVHLVDTLFEEMKQEAVAPA